MNNPLEYVDKLATRARQERVPQGDVSRRILRRLPARETAVGLPHLVFTTGYAAVACGALVYGYVLFGSMSDPLLSLFNQASVVMP